MFLRNGARDLNFSASEDSTPLEVNHAPIAPKGKNFLRKGPNPS